MTIVRRLLRPGGLLLAVASLAAVACAVLVQDAAHAWAPQPPGL
jgi:hypothetical protein